MKDFGLGYQSAWARSQLGMYGKIIDLVPTAWLLAIACPTPAEKTELGFGSEWVGLDGLWKNVVEQGLRDPMLISVSLKTGHGRMEAGNHRIRLAEWAGLPFMPAIVLAGNIEIHDPGNGTHLFDLRADLLLEINPEADFSDRIMAPTEVFRSLRAIKSELPDDKTYRLPVERVAA
jgi:hypothetical protein